MMPVTATGQRSGLDQWHFEGGRYEATCDPGGLRSLHARDAPAKALGPNDRGVATSLNNLATLYLKLGRYAEAEPFSKRSLSINEKVLGPNHPDVATSMNNLASLYEAQGRYADAEPLYKRSLAIKEKALGPVSVSDSKRPRAKNSLVMVVLSGIAKALIFFSPKA
jgi:tetratricopeptide (TPR) repeat protein